MAGERGSGVGKGGGGGGTIRDAGGSFGKMEAAHEDQYFYNLVSIFFGITVLINSRSTHYTSLKFFCSKRNSYKKCERAYTMKSRFTRNKLSVIKKLLIATKSGLRTWIRKNKDIIFI